MSKYTRLTESLYQYVIDHSLREPEPLKKLRLKMANFPGGGMQISPDQGQFMAFLVSVLQARNTLEIGVFTGYSSACVARALPEDGRIVACDINDEYVSHAREVWCEMGIAHKIDFRLGPALDTLSGLLEQGMSKHFDFAFIDADKDNNKNYYEYCLKLVRSGGIIAVDNVLLNGNVIDPAKDDSWTVAVRAFNEFVHEDSRVDVSFLTISDGLLLARKR